MDPTAPATSTAGLGTTGLKPAGNASLGSTMGKDEFLKLLMAQLEYQDPMSPMADHEFVAQLATFSGLEQQMVANERLGELQLSQLSSGNAQLAGFIGKDVVARGDTITLDDGPAAPIAVKLDGPASQVRVTVRDASGSVVSVIEGGPRAAGGNDIAWPGTDGSGNPLPPGNYTVSVDAKDGNGQPVSASTLITGVVSGLSFENGYAELLVGSRRIQPADIISVGAPASTNPIPTANPNPPANPAPEPPSPGIGG